MEYKDTIFGWWRVWWREADTELDPSLLDRETCFWTLKQKIYTQVWRYQLSSRLESDLAGGREYRWLGIRWTRHVQWTGYSQSSCKQVRKWMMEQVELLTYFRKVGSFFGKTTTGHHFENVFSTHKRVSLAWYVPQRHLWSWWQLLLGSSITVTVTHENSFVQVSVSFHKHMLLLPTFYEHRFLRPIEGKNWKKKIWKNIST